MLKGAGHRGWDEGCYLEKLSPWQPPYPPPSGHRSPVSMKVSTPPSFPISPPWEVPAEPQGCRWSSLGEKLQGCWWHSCKQPPKTPTPRQRKPGHPHGAVCRDLQHPLPSAPCWQGNPTVSLTWAERPHFAAGLGDGCTHPNTCAVGTEAEIKTCPLPLHVALGAAFPYDFSSLF